MSSTTEIRSEHDYKDIVRRLYQEVWTEANFSNVSAYHAPQITFHIRGRALPLTAEDLIRIVTRWHQAFSELRFEVQALLAEGDVVAARLRYRGAHTGAWKGLASTGRTVEVHEMLFFRFEHGQIAEVWEVPDEYALRQQLTGPAA